MDNIRKKMQSLKYETDNLLEETAKLEAVTRYGTGTPIRRYWYIYKKVLVQV